jgi:hypothetical protein
MKLKIVIIILSSIGLSAYYFYHGKQNNPSASFQWQQSNESNIKTIDHGIWQEILQTYVDTMHKTKVHLFDYGNVAEEDVHQLAKYINQLSMIDPRDYRRIEQKAYWINLYNALTVQLVIDNYPIESITKLGKKVTAFGPWDNPLITIRGEDLSLNDIEHKILRPFWKDPRIHFAVNCASYSCPNLQDTAFTSDNLEALLNQAAKEYMTHPRAVKFVDNELMLSSIFDWYAEDFGASSGEILHYLIEYLPNDLAGKLENYQGEIRYEYDWRLNDVETFE